MEVWRNLTQDSLLTGRAGKARSRSAPLTVDQRHLHAAFSQDFISKAVQGLEGTFLQPGGSLYTLGYTRDLRTEVNVMFLQLHNVMPSSVFHYLYAAAEQHPVCQAMYNEAALKSSFKSY